MIRYREATVVDVPDLEHMRNADAEWPADPRMARYLRCEHHPQKALDPRVMYLAEGPEGVVGYIGGHLTERFDCDGELQYLYVAPAHRRGGVASEMFRLLAGWFDEHGASRICVDVEPDNHGARGFYQRHGATDLNSHWLVWADFLPS